MPKRPCFQGYFPKWRLVTRLLGLGPDEIIVITYFPVVRDALYNLAGLFITGSLKHEAQRPEVRSAVAALVQIAKMCGPA